MSTASIRREVPSVEVEVEFCADHGLQLERLPDYGWLVRRQSGENDRQVIGCIDQLEKTVELMELDGGFRWTAFDSLHDALAYLILRMPEPGEERVFDPILDREPSSSRSMR